MGKNPRRARTASGIKNYRFSKEDTNQIVHFIEENFEVAFEELTANTLLLIEKNKIKEYQPILNSVNNPQPSIVVKRNRSRCHSYASEFLHLT